MRRDLVTQLSSPRRAGFLRRGFGLPSLSWPVVVALLFLVAAPGRAGAQASATPTVRGIVLDATTRAPIADVNVQAGERVVRTGPDGDFRISAAPGAVLTFRRLGYKRTEVSVRDTSALLVEMHVAARTLESVVVTAARREQRLADAVATTELISRSDIEQKGATDVAQAMRDAGGVQTEAGVPSGTGVLLQGLGSRRVLVLVDGQPIVGRINGNLDLSRLTSTNVERIEIVKGPQSTLYGSDAMGGVVNVITRRPEQTGIEADALGVVGSHGRRDMNANARWMSSDRQFNATIDGGSRFIELVPGRQSNTSTFAERYDIAPSLTWRPVEKLSLEAAVSATEERQRYQLGQLYQHSDNLQLAGRITGNRITRTGRIATTLYATRFEHLSRRSTTPLPASHEGERDEQSLFKMDVAASGSIAGIMLDGGVDARREEALAARVEGGRRSLHAVEPYAQATVTRGALSIVPGARMSWSEQWGTAVTPKAAVLWRPVESFAVRASAAAGYRAPDFKELYLDFVNAPAGYAVRGNPDLRPEHSTSYSSSLEWYSTLGNASASAFHTRFRDFIESAETATPGEYTYYNVAEGTTSGVELGGSLGTGSNTLDASYAWLRATDDRGSPLLGRAAHAARIAGTVARGGGPRLTVSSSFTSRTPTARDSSGAVTTWRASYTRVDARLAQRLTRYLDLAVSVENVLDRSADAGWPGYTGRMWSVSGRLTR